MRCVKALIVVITWELSNAKEAGDIVVHLDHEGSPPLLEVLRASELLPIMVKEVALGEVAV